MRTRTVVAVGVLVLASLTVASLAGASSSSSPFKRYTLVAAPPSQVASPGKLTVLLPANWQVKTAWSPSATDPQHPGVSWGIGAGLMPKGTTLADIRASWNHPGCYKGWGYEKRTGGTYLTLPVGTVLHSTLRSYSDKACQTLVGVLERYWLDRKILSLGGPNAAREVFLWFDTGCPANQCQAHNGQFAAIMHSIRITP